MKRMLIGLLWINCASAQDMPSTFRGEPIVQGSDPDSIVRTIDHPDLFGVWSSIENGRMGLGVFQKGTGKPYLQLLDTDSDGVVDLLTYSVLDAEGNIIKSIEDFGMDGQVDFKMDSVSGAVQVFYRGQWRDGVHAEPRGMSIEVDGEPVPLAQALSELGRDKYVAPPVVQVED